MTNFLFANEVTHDELKMLTKKYAEMVRGLAFMSLEGEIEEELKRRLAYNMCEEDRLYFTWTVATDVGTIKAILAAERMKRIGKTNKNKKHKR